CLDEHDEPDKRNTKRTGRWRKTQLIGSSSTTEKDFVGSLLPSSPESLPHLHRLLCPRTVVLSLAVVCVHSPRTQRLDSHGDISIMWCFTAEPSISLQRFGNTLERL